MKKVVLVLLLGVFLLAGAPTLVATTATPTSIADGNGGDYGTGGG